MFMKSKCGNDSYWFCAELVLLQFASGIYYEMVESNLKSLPKNFLLLRVTFYESAKF